MLATYINNIYYSYSSLKQTKLEQMFYHFSALLHWPEKPVSQNGPFYLLSFVGVAWIRQLSRIYSRFRGFYILSCHSGVSNVSNTDKITPEKKQYTHLWNYQPVKDINTPPPPPPPITELPTQLASERVLSYIKRPKIIINRMSDCFILLADSGWRCDGSCTGARYSRRKRHHYGSILRSY